MGNSFGPDESEDMPIWKQMGLCRLAASADAEICNKFRALVRPINPAYGCGCPA